MSPESDKTEATYTAPISILLPTCLRPQLPFHSHPLLSLGIYRWVKHGFFHLFQCRLWSTLHFGSFDLLDTPFCHPDITILPYAKPKKYRQWADKLTGIQWKQSYPFFQQRIQLAVEKLCWAWNSSSSRSCRTSSSSLFYTKAKAYNTCTAPQVAYRNRLNFLVQI